MKEGRIFTIPARPTPVVIFCVGNYLFIFGPHICSTNQNFWRIIMINKLIKSNVIFLYIYTKHNSKIKSTRLEYVLFFFFLVMPCSVFDHIQCFDYQPELKGVLSWFWLYSSILLLFWFLVDSHDFESRRFNLFTTHQTFGLHYFYDY